MKAIKYIIAFCYIGIDRNFLHTGGATIRRQDGCY